MILPAWFAVVVWIGFLGIIVFIILTLLHLFRNVENKLDVYFWLVIILILPVIGSLIYLETLKQKQE